LLNLATERKEDFGFVVTRYRLERRGWFASVSLMSAKQLQDYAALDKKVDQKSPTFTPAQIHPVEARKSWLFSLIYFGAGRGSRTPKTRRSADFESAASASSAIPARGIHSMRRLA
jgi:hypothetical protein